MKTLIINFGSPENGWMKVAVSSLDSDVSFYASDVPCDSLRGLVTVLGRILDGSAKEVVEWSLEPEYAEWVLVRDKDQIELLVNFPRGPFPTFRYKGTAMKVIRRICKSLRDLQCDSAWQRPDASESIWSWDFPDDQLAVLLQRIRKAEQGY
jgi:hypothetical protein